MRARIVTFGVVVFLLAALVSAQTGQLSGVVKDSAGAVIPGVTVAASSAALVENVRYATTDASGKYQFTALPAGTYRLTFTLQGFVTLVRENVAVTNSAVVADASMKVGAVQETITVVAPEPIAGGATSRQVLRGDDVQSAPQARSAPAGGAGRGGGRAAGMGAGFGFGSADLAAPPPAAMPAPVLQGLAIDGLRYVPSTPRNQESYAANAENDFRRVTDDPLSTFSIDVDTASYANVRRFLNEGRLPPPAAVRIEEMINYFKFDYPQPGGAAPFSVTTELVDAPWNPAHRLALVGLQGRDTYESDRTPRNLVFLIDVSGSMQPADKLPLVKNGMRMLVDTLNPRDHVAIVVYAGNTGLVLPSTPGDRKSVIHDAIERLQAGGSTNGGAGIKLAYEIARQQFARGGVNRVILATDGDFNVGVTSQKELTDLIEAERKSGVFLTVLGVGTGNIKDSTMEMLADKGNGNYAYLDSIQEAQRVLVREAASTLITIAKDVKIQIEFNPQTVAAYRLIGYENRLLKAEDFNDDRKDAGEIGAGHSVTALYEIVPVGVDVPGPSVDRLKYQQTTAKQAPSPAPQSQYADELMTVKLRYKQPDSDTSRLMTTAVKTRPQGTMTNNVGFASAVAEMGMLLRGSQYSGKSTFDAVVARARKHRGTDPDGYRAEFAKLAELARSLRSLQTTSTTTGAADDIRAVR